MKTLVSILLALTVIVGFVIVAKHYRHVQYCRAVMEAGGCASGDATLPPADCGCRP